MRKLIVALLAFIALAASLIPTLASSHLVNGQVTKIDQSAGKITIKHEPLKKFDMNEPMTMVFRVQDAAMLKQLKIGDTVRFEAEKVNGQFTVTKIEKAK